MYYGDIEEYTQYIDNQIYDCVISNWEINNEHDKSELDKLVECESSYIISVIALMITEIYGTKSNEAYKYIKDNEKKADIIKHYIIEMQEDPNSLESITSSLRVYTGTIINYTLDDNVNELILRLIVQYCSDNNNNMFTYETIEKARYYIEYILPEGKLIDSEVLNALGNNYSLIRSIIDFKKELLDVKAYNDTVNSDIQLAKIVCQGQSIKRQATKIKKLAMIGESFDISRKEYKDVTLLMLLVCIDIIDGKLRVKLEKLKFISMYTELVKRQARFLELNQMEQNLILCRIRVISKLDSYLGTDELNKIIFNSVEYEKFYNRHV